ncbi:MAG: hypothetical protein ACOVQA_12970 [Thermoflexibacteraceae bacterium]
MLHQLTYFSKKSYLWSFFCFFLINCSKNYENHNQCFYYWKTTIDSTSIQPLKEIKIKLENSRNALNPLYIHFFDVIQQATTVMPAGVLQINDDCLRGMVLVPVIYIKNEVFLNMPKDSLANLADLVSQKLINMLARHDLRTPNEFQIDCDWTQKTQENYFQFLRLYKQVLREKLQTNIVLSCTIRLYPMKYAKKMGVPPVDSGVLMCYNLKNPTILHPTNSILSLDEAKGYLPALKNYPLRLDLALPTFSWVTVFRNGKFLKLVNGVGTEHLREQPFLASNQEFFFTVRTSKDFMGTALQIGDILKVEAPSPKTIRQVHELANEYLPAAPQRVIYFHLDAQNVKEYGELWK